MAGDISSRGFKKKDLDSLVDNLFHTWINAQGASKICVIGADFNVRTYVVERMRELVYKKGAEASVCGMDDAPKDVIEGTYPIRLDSFLGDLPKG